MVMKFPGSDYQGQVYLICCAQQGQLIPFWLLYFPMIKGAVNFYMYTLSSEEHRRRVTRDNTDVTISTRTASKASFVVIGGTQTVNGDYE